MSDRFALDEEDREEIEEELGIDEDPFVIVDEAETVTPDSDPIEEEAGLEVDLEELISTQRKRGVDPLPITQQPTDEEGNEK